ncbi:hypothetical protein EV193_11972 [Herbihabitans rhizosphaerae]|uniref:Uncharacterized protein n=1 Tax=Herbihabitans rhizosphaerae TaxID=1872711 RepID=A0A4Q7KCN5_9PSEU|nr:hypothetical protein [Herbihabitans rhizosphaerae]RZS29668.1 hypothetical protein EV193_11972 [Herbihabitans rhizosphaerae]
MVESVPPARTVCHGCRQVTHVRVEDDDGNVTLRPMILPGEGVTLRERAPGRLVQESCPVCGESDDPGWIPGFVPPA